jgi:phage tail sheath protein FI
MAFQLSPGVSVNEIDLTNVAPAVSSSIGAIAGTFNAGPVNQIVTISSEKNLIATFGLPTNDNYIPFFQASSFLQYGRNLKVVRVASGHLNATADSTGLQINNEDAYDIIQEAGATNVGIWAARQPGTLGNSLSVEICTADSSAFDSWDYASSFDSTPATSEYAAAFGGADDEMHIIVVDSQGTITGTPGAILERFEYLSQASDARKDNGANNYYKRVINTESKYIFWMDHDAGLTNAGNDSTNTFATSSVIVEVLGGGADGNVVSTGDLQLGLDKFADADTVDINLLIAPLDAATESILAKYSIENIAGVRQDIVAFASPPIAATLGSSTPAADVKSFADAINSSSYGFVDSTAVKMYDKYNDVYRWIPSNGHMAGLCANVDNVADAWVSPAGVNRGQLLGVSRLAFNPDRTARDTLYKNRVNPIVTFPGQGTFLYGDKTMLTRPSAFDRINVRRLFNLLEKSLATAAKFQLFEMNDEFTRAQFRSIAEPFLREVKGRGGITDSLVVCDSTNNTGQVIDTNRFIADIYVKPARSINFITLNFIATRTGVEFSEIVG